MKSATSKPVDELRMSSSKFDSLMRRALDVPPTEAPSVKKSATKDAKTVRQKAGSTK